jgi:uncharacterized membrane protein
MDTSAQSSPEGASRRPRTGAVEPPSGPGSQGPAEGEPQPSDRAEHRARNLGWLGICVGLARLASPGGVSLFAVGTDGQRRRRTMRLAGAWELACGIALLAQPSAPRWLWMRVAGDVLDLALLGSTLGARRTKKARVLRSILGVLGVTALDTVTSVEVTRHGRAHPADEEVFTRAITVNRSQQEVYQFWRNLQNLPRFMLHLETIHIRDNRRSRWTARGPSGARLEWEVELTADRPNQLISWRSLEGSQIESAGTVRFRPAPGGRGTEIVLVLEFIPPPGSLGVTLTQLLGEEPSRKAASDLRRFKQVVETGEVLHSDASIHRGPHPARPPEAREIPHDGGRR